jgi:REP element-mobilizing transposase RayT
MEILYNNLYTHFVFTTLDRFPCIAEIHRERIEKYITGIVSNYQCKLYAIYANPEHHKKQTFAEEYDNFLKFYQHTLSGK